MRARRGGALRQPAAKLGPLPARSVGVGLGLLRCAIGAVMVGDPPRLAQLLGVDTVTARQTGWLTMMIGGREIALGVGSLIALGGGHGGRTWYTAQAVTDTGDALALATAARSGRVSAPLAMLVAASALGGAALNLAAARAAGED